jgi:uncharacterized membrane protein
MLENTSSGIFGDGLCKAMAPGRAGEAEGKVEGESTTMNEERVHHVVTLVCALGCGLIAGVFFGFSAFVMRALGRIESRQGIAAMQSINVVVINPVFLGVFLGTAVGCVALLIWSVMESQAPGAGYRLAGSVSYLAGTVGVTGACNVPRNNALAAIDGGSAEGARYWADYRRAWTGWNHVRTVASLAAAAALTIGLG